MHCCCGMLDTVSVAALCTKHFECTAAQQVAVGQGRRFEYAGGYWEARAAGHWTDCPNMFADNMDGAGVYM